MHPRNSCKQPYSTVACNGNSRNSILTNPAELQGNHSDYCSMFRIMLQLPSASVFNHELPFQASVGGKNRKFAYYVAIEPLVKEITGQRGPSSPARVCLAKLCTSHFALYRTSSHTTVRGCHLPKQRPRTWTSKAAAHINRQYQLQRALFDKLHAEHATASANH